MDFPTVTIQLQEAVSPQSRTDQQVLSLWPEPPVAGNLLRSKKMQFLLPPPGRLCCGPYTLVGRPDGAAYLVPAWWRLRAAHVLAALQSTNFNGT
jgi:hypothetical protein